MKDVGLVTPCNGAFAMKTGSVTVTQRAVKQLWPRYFSTHYAVPKP